MGTFRSVNRRQVVPPSTSIRGRPKGAGHMNPTIVPSHRRAASRSGGATSAERDGRPVFRRNGPRGAAAERGSSQRAWRSQAPLKMPREASGRKATGGRLAPLPWAPRRASHRYAPSRTPRGPRIERPAEHENSRTGGRAVHGIVPPASEFQWAQCRGGHPRESRIGEARHSHQAGRRAARRWPPPLE
jgi:hypothetical protein